MLTRFSGRSPVRWYQFRFQMLLVLFTVAAIMLAYQSHRYREHLKQYRDFARLVGGTNERVLLRIDGEVELLSAEKVKAIILARADESNYKLEILDPLRRGYLPRDSMFLLEVSGGHHLLSCNSREQADEIVRLINEQLSCGKAVCGRFFWYVEDGLSPYLEICRFVFKPEDPVRTLNYRSTDKNVESPSWHDLESKVRENNLRRDARFSGAR